jgi:hypothetical protein
VILAALTQDVRPEAARQAEFKDQLTALAGQVDALPTAMQRVVDILATLVNRTTETPASQPEPEVRSASYEEMYADERADPAEEEASPPPASQERR